MMRSIRLRHIAWLMAAALGVTACHSLTPLTLDEVHRLQPPRLWVTEGGELSAIEFSGPRVYNDTLVGYVNGAFTELPASKVGKMVVKRPARAKTIALIAASTAGAVGIAVWISGIGEPSPQSMVDCYDVPMDPRCNP